MSLDINPLRNSTVWQLHRMRDRIELDPEYQRMSDIWTLEKRQLLIDSILNGFDIPKFYLHKFSKPKTKGDRTYDYAIVDGKQRLGTIWSFIDGSITLDEGFEFFKDGKVKAGGMTYRELGIEHPDLKADFDGFLLSVMCIETDDIEMIEEMFSRLNEAMPLSAAEKRNAYGGPIPSAVRKLAKERFFTASIPFPNKRYRHFDLATKFLLAEHEGRVVDTKKAYLDKFVQGFADSPRNRMPGFLEKAQENVGHMSKVFSNNDWLLRQVGMVTVYYHMFRMARDEDWVEQITRKKLVEFEELRDQNRRSAETDLANADYELIEFDRYAQSPNDAGAIKFRLRVMLDKVFNKKVQTDSL